MRFGAIISFGLMAACVKLASERGVAIGEILFWRFAISFFPTLLWIRLGSGLQAIRPKRPLAHVWRAAIGLTAMYLVFLSLSLLPLAEVTTIHFAAPLFATLLSIPVLGERVGARRLIAILVGFAGVVIVTQPQSGNLPLAGALVAIGAAIAVGLAQVTVRQISRSENSEAIVFWFALVAVIATGILQPWLYSPHDAASWALLGGVGVLGGLAQIFITKSLEAAPLQITAPFDYSQLLIATLLGWLIWSDMPRETTWIGAALIIATGLYTIYRERKLARMARGSAI
ncbi:MAG: DMT family transporter [Sphingomonadaceae bacterium]|nr:DMT family transporter [Sphingomonadaceae bacterium]